MTGSKENKPPTQILQPETLRVQVKIYPPTIKRTIVQFVYDNCVIHVVGLAAAFIVCFGAPLFIEDAALEYTIGFVTFLLTFLLGVFVDIYGEGKFRLWEDFFKLKK